MDDRKIICPECSTVNEEDFEYCKNCGTPLKAQDTTVNEPVAQPVAQPVPPTYNVNPNGVILNTIDGHSSADIATFVGKNSYKFLTKFSKMEITGGKVNWCWPAAVLGFFFGPFGAALWFLYRKMYKVAAIIIAVGFSLTALNSIFFGTAIPLEEIMGSIVSGVEGGSVDFSFLDSLYQTAIYSRIQNIIYYAFSLFGGLFGTGLYKSYVKQKISNYKARCVDPNYYSFGLSAVGGTSGGGLAIGIILAILLADAAVLLPSFI